MSRLLAYGLGVISGLGVAGLVGIALSGRDKVYVTERDFTVALDRATGDACSLPAGTRLTHTWSASEGFDQYCLALNVENVDRAAIAPTDDVGTSPYWLSAHADEP